jgi:hypothetical protein
LKTKNFFVDETGEGRHPHRNLLKRNKVTGKQEMKLNATEEKQNNSEAKKERKK